MSKVFYFFKKSIKIYEQIDNAHKFVLNHINMRLIGDGLASTPHFEIPSKAIREIICNAVCHRVIIEHSHVQVAVYDDRVEVTSPGGLYGGLTMEKMLCGRTATRNTCVANVLAYTELIEYWGTGIKRVLEMCEEYGVKEPEFIDFGDAIRVNIYRPTYLKSQNDKVNSPVNSLVNSPVNSPVKLSETEEKIVDLIENNERITYKLLAFELEKDISTIKKAIKKLKEKGIIEHIGSDKNGSWKILKK